MDGTENNANIKDFWTQSSWYRRKYQNAKQIEDILSLLRLEDAAGLVDIGCGSGVFAVEAARRHPECQVWACDPLDSAVAECHRQAAETGAVNLHAFVARVESVPLIDDCADRILMRNALHHVVDTEAAFSEISRLLMPGGRLVLEGPCNAWDDETGKLLTDLHMLMDDSHRRVYRRPAVMIAALKRRGLRSESVEQRPYPFRIGPEQVSLIRQNNAEGTLGLRRRKNDGWGVELQIACLIATKTTNGRKGNEDKG